MQLISGMEFYDLVFGEENWKKEFDEGKWRKHSWITGLKYSNLFFYSYYKVMAVNEISTRNWYAVYTRSKFESKVCKNLEKKKIIYFYPQYNRHFSSWSGLHQEPVPLIPSYIFVCVNENERRIVNRTDGVINFVYWLCEPVVIPNWEIEVIRKVVNEYSAICVEKTSIDLHTGNTEQDSLLPVSNGFLKDRPANAVRFRLPSLGYILEATTKKEDERPVQEPVPVLKFFHSERFHSAFNLH